MEPTNDDEELSIQTTPYQEAVGCLTYLMSTSLQDIAFATNHVARFSHNPEPAHWEGVERILSLPIYQEPTTTVPISVGAQVIRLQVSQTQTILATLKRRSTTGFIFLLNGGPVAWDCKRQKCTSLLTSESEYVVACESTREAVWLKQLLIETVLQEANPNFLLCDYQSAEGAGMI